MAATIKIKNSSTAGAAPTSSDLVQGELAVNVTDKRLYTENSGGTIVELGTNPSVPVTFPDGSASAPSLTNDGDTNTGLFFPAADTIALTTGGTERLRLDSSGNLGLGVTPSAWASSNKALQISSRTALSDFNGGTRLVNNAYWNGTNYISIANAAASIFIQDTDSAFYWQQAAANGAGGTLSFGTKMTLDASGNLGLGTTSPTSYGSTYSVFEVAGSASGVINVKSGSTLYGQISNGTNLFKLDAVGASSSLLFLTNTTERARIDSSGNLLVGTTSSLGTGITVSNAASGTQIGIRNTSATAGNYWNIGGTSDSRLYIINAASTGVYMTYGATSWTGISDERAKDIIEPITNAANKVSTLRAVIGKYKTDSDGIRRSFLIAQDVQAVFPEAVDATNPEMLGVSYTDTIPLLVAAIKEQQAIITQLQADVAALKG